MSTAAPGTPKRNSQALLENEKILSRLSSRWGLRLEPPKEGESPSVRQEKLAARVGGAEDQCKKYELECGFKVLYLCRKDKDALQCALEGFEYSASVLQSGWVPKQSADDDLLPRSVGPRRMSMTAEQRQLLLECLLRFLKPAFDDAKKQNGSGHIGQSSRYPSFEGSHVFDSGGRKVKLVNDTPVPLHLGLKGSAKRSSGGSFDIHEVSKKPKLPDGEPSLQAIMNAVGDVPVKAHHAKSGPSFSAASNSSITLFNDVSSEVFDLAAPHDEQMTLYKAKGGDTANSSFVSESSTVFSRSTGADTSLPRFSRQPSCSETSIEKEPLSSLAKGHYSNSDGIDLNEGDIVTAGFASTIADSDTKGEFRISCDLHTPEEALRRRLQNIFRLYVIGKEKLYLFFDAFLDESDNAPGSVSRTLAHGVLSLLVHYDVVHIISNNLYNLTAKLPGGLANMPLRHRYEITRVCLHTGVNLDDLLVSPNDVVYIQNIQNYYALWKYLKDRPALKKKEFPMRTPEDVWAASKGAFHSGFNGVVLSAKLHFRESEEGPLFNVKLQPLKMETSHRLGRRFGNDRFIEISLPGLSGEKLPKSLKQAGAASRKIIIEWLVHGLHEFLGVTWKPFYVKDVDKKKTKIDLFATDELDNTTRFSTFAFATDGIDFQASNTIPERGEDSRNHTKMTVDEMINWLIPLERNKKQSFLKLFQRIPLGLSKTYATVELDYHEIICREDLLSADKAEVMNDGCGQISLKMATEVSHCLKLTYIPSGFQARIGGAKGFWIVNTQDDPCERWIEVYSSQTKWQADYKAILEEKDHRTFEVIRWVQPLKPAALNLQFLPLLEDRGEPKEAMRVAISQLLENGLRYGMTQQSEAMDNPQSFRVWTHSLNPGTQDRIKHGQVPYEAGLPISLEEKLNMLLDAGFDPKRLRFLKDLVWKAYSDKCELLKRKLNITVELSTYAYMAVDFTGTLEPNEVYLCFSSAFKVEPSGYSEVLLDDIDVLVARSPAHYVSDIQKVKAVWKRELKSVKDIIVFSSKGNCPLAKKLSGGDYDGDIAWVCWEPTLVEPFRNEEMPEFPDLEKLGYVKKDRTPYADLITDFPHNSISVFLEQSFDFNLRWNLLGICTIFKEELCYTINSVRKDSIVFLSTLLSYLVDQNKQGYIFTKEDWEHIKETVIKIKPRRPFYKFDKFEGNRPIHIIDYLKFDVAEKTVETALTEFHTSLKHAEYWDDDVIQYARWAEEQEKTSNDWKALLAQLKQDIAAVKDMWSAHFREKDSRGVEEVMANFQSILHPLYQRWLDIRPSTDVSPLLVGMLLPSGLPNQELSEWALLKASVAFASFPPKYVPKFVWWMCGRQLAVLKAKFRSGSGGGGLVALTPEMHAMLKPNATFVKLQRAEEHEPRFWEARAESSVALEEEAASDDND